MKITLFTDADVFAGTERHILDLALALRAQGCPAEIACPGKGVLAERARQAGVPVWAVEKGCVMRDAAAVRRLRRRFRSGEVELVHSHNGRSALLAATAAALAGCGATVTTQHFLEPARTTRRGLRAWLGSAAHRWVLERAGRVVAISGPVRERILARREAPPEKVERVWNGISDPALAPLRDRAEVRADFGIAPAAPLVVSAARLETEKMVHVLIDAMAQLTRQMPEAKCVVAGEGRQRAALQEKIQSAGLVQSVRLAGFQEDVLSLVRAGDVFALPSAAEPFGLALVEAMALGRPVIGTRAGGPLEIIEEGVSGLLVPPADAAALSAALFRVLSEPGLAARLGAGGRARFEQHFTAPRMAGDMLAVYRAVLQR